MGFILVEDLDTNFRQVGCVIAFWKEFSTGYEMGNFTIQGDSKKENNHNKEVKEKEEKEKEELKSSDIKNLGKKFGKSPSGQEVINFISQVHSEYPSVYVTGITLKNSVTGITAEASNALGEIQKVTKNGTEIVVTGSTQIKILPVLKLNIADNATFSISTMTPNQIIVDVSGIKVGWFNFNQVTINPASVIVNIGGKNMSFDLK